MPSGLKRILDRDLQAAGIPKKDDRGRTIDVHALRHTFGTMLSQNGVAPRTVQSAMRHSKIDLTMNCYTDPRLLDVAGALDKLPAFSLNRPASQESDSALFTGTDDRKGGVQLAQWLATNSAPMCISGSKPVTLGKMFETQVGKPVRPENVENPTKKGSFSTFENEPLKRPRRDLNPQPPDRQSGDAEFQPVTLQLVTKADDPVSPCVSPIDRVSETTPDNSYGPPSDDFGAALAMIATLPLSDDEKAEAVRRLLSQRAP